MVKIRKRGSYETIEELIAARYEAPKASWKFNLKNAVDIIMEAVRNKEKISIMGDYDVDGIVASAIMKMTLCHLGVEDPYIRIPLRFTEGYGMKPSMLDNIESGLVITVDNGITCFDAIKTTHKKGLKVIVTDHHLPAVDENGKMVLPDAECVIDPHVEEMTGESGYDSFSYCGSGIALKLTEALIPDDSEFISKLCSLAAVATVADAVPMSGENREIVKAGIKQIVDGNTTAGLKEIFRKNNINLSGLSSAVEPHNLINPDVLGYRIGPCINAASRVQETAGGAEYPYVMDGGDGAKISLNCILAEDPRRAETLATALSAFNETRKSMTKSGVEKAEKYIAENKLAGDPVLVVYCPDIKKGIIGIVAGRLCDEYRRPAIVISGTEMCHGSCRSPEGYHMKDILDHANTHLEAYGGHAAAAGITVKEEDIKAFREDVKKSFTDKYTLEDADDAVEYDLEIAVLEAPGALAEMSSKITPFGEGNPEPVFYVRDFYLQSVSVLTSKNAGTKHLKLYDGLYNALMFNVDDADEIAKKLKTMVGKEVPMIATVSYNCFQGRLTPQMFIQNLLID